MEITVSNEIRIDEPTAEVLEWVRKNLTFTNPDYVKKQRMGFYTGNTPKTLCLYEKHGKSLFVPYGVLDSILYISERVRAVGDFPPPAACDFGEGIPLYPYQEKAVEACARARHGILKSPAGSGKTQMGLALVQTLGRRALWITHTLDLLEQSKRRAEAYFDRSLIGTISGGKVNIGEGITFATVQTLSKLDLGRYRDEWDCVIVDECHRVAGSPTTVTQFYKVLSALSARHKYGLSATVHRADGMTAAIYALLGGIAYAVPDAEVTGRVMKVGIRRIDTGAGLTRCCYHTDGTLDYTGMLDYLVHADARNALIANLITENRGKPGLILSDRLEQLELIMEHLPGEVRADAVMVSGKMTTKAAKAARAQAIEDMRSGAKKYLFATYSLAKEGLDIPRLERLYLATPQKDYAVITQSIGRIARTCDGKRDPICYDFVDFGEYFVRAYKRRAAVYRKGGCYFIEV